MGVFDLFGVTLGWLSSAESIQQAGAPWPRNRRYEYAVEFESPSGEVYTPAWVEGLRWSTYYGSEGSGYGALEVRLARRIGFDYNDLGFGFEVRVRYGLKTILFCGQIREVSEQIGGGVEMLAVTALGWGVIFGDDQLNWIFCDTRLGEWEIDPDASGSYRPDRFSSEKRDGLLLSLRGNTHYEQNDYVAIRYTVPSGQTLSRFSASWELNIPSGWGGSARLEIKTSAGEDLLSQTADGSGSIDEVVATGSPTWVEMRLYSTATAGTNYAMDETEDGLCWGKLTNVKVWGDESADITGQEIFTKLVAVASESEHGMSSSTAEIGDPAVALEPAAFDSDWKLEQIAKWAAQFGDYDNRAVAWGVRFNEDRVIFLETIDRATVGYSVGKDSLVRAETAGDWSKSWQKRYGRYKDESGTVVRTADVEDADTIEALGGYARRSDLEVSVTSDSDLVATILDLAIAESGPIGTKSSLSLSGFVRSGNGGEMFCELMQAGKMLRVEDFRAREAALEGGYNLSDTYTTGLAAVVEVDAISHTVRVALGSESDTLARYLAILGELRG